MTNPIINNVKDELTQNNILRVGINASNFLLVSSIDIEGVPFGIAPDLGRMFAEEIDATPKFIVFETPGKLADAGLEGAWDIAFVGNEPQRAKDIAFSAPYLEIPVTFLVRENSPINSLSDIDRVGNRISVMGRSAYDLYLTATIKNATIIRAQSIDESFEQFVSDELEVLDSHLTAKRYLGVEFSMVKLHPSSNQQEHSPPIQPVPNTCMTLSNELKQLV